MSIREASKLVILVGVLTISTICVFPTAYAQPSTDQRVAALCDSGFALLDREEFERAREVFDAALRLRPNSISGLLGMGRVMMELPAGVGRALEYLKKALQQAPDSLEVHYYKALAHIGHSRTGVGRSDARQALRELDWIIDHDLLHEDAYYQRGVVLRDYFRDYEGAVQQFRNQIDVFPGHMNARLALLENEMDVGGWDNAVAAAESIITREPDRWEVYPALAGAYWMAGRLDEAMKAFEICFPLLPEKELDLYFDLSHVLAPAEQKEFKGLDEEGRNNYWTHYWRSRDPDPKTMVNERLLEHFIRIAYSRIEFGTKVWPWDARGNLYVRYGEPDIRTGPGRPYAMGLIEDDWDFFIKKRDLHEELGLQRISYRPVFDSSGTPFRMTNGSATPIRWYYLDRGIDLSFDNPVMSGRYLNASRMLTEAMERRLPVVSKEEEKIDHFDPLQSAVTFRGDDGRTALEYAIGLLPEDYRTFDSLSGAYARLDARMELYTTKWKPVADASDTVRHVAVIPQVRVRGIPVFVHGVRLEVEPGEYLFSTLLIDAETGRRMTSDEEVILPDYTGDHLMVSDILPAARIREVGDGQPGRFIRGNLEVIPLPGRNLGIEQPLFIYFEVYNLAKDEYGATNYRIEYTVAEIPYRPDPIQKLYQGLKSVIGGGGRRAVLSSDFMRSGIESNPSTYLEIDMSHLPDGIYELWVEISDLLSGQTASNVIRFRTLPPTPGPPQE